MALDSLAQLGRQARSGMAKAPRYPNNFKRGQRRCERLPHVSLVRGARG